MTRQKALAYGAGTLAVLLAVQLALLPRGQGNQMVASWANRPRDIQAATELATLIVRARVTAVRPANDLVMKVEGEPNGEDRIPAEVVTIAVEGVYKGTPRPSEELFHTGTATIEDRGRLVPPRPANVKADSVRRPSAEERRSLSLDDDPPYRVGERYVLFLREGPTITVGGMQVRTQAVIAPEGRFGIAADNTLLPASTLQFARSLRGQPLTVLERQLPKFSPVAR